MLKRRDAFLKKSALAVSVALLLSSQALAHKTLSEPLTGTIWFDNGTQSLESASVIDRNGNANDGGSVTVTGKTLLLVPMQKFGMRINPWQWDIRQLFLMQTTVSLWGMALR